MIGQIIDAIKEPLSALGRFLNPDRRREAKKDLAIRAAERLILIFEALYEHCSDEYRTWDRDKLKDFKIHYKKQFDAWKHG